VWLAPYCEFSTYKTTASSSTGGSTGGGGGGGGGGGSSASTIVVEEAQLAAGYTYDLGAKDKFRFIVASETHYVTVNSVSSTAVSVNVTSALQQATIGVGTSRSFELTGDSYYDMSVTVNSVNTTSSKASLTIKSVHELVPGGAAQPSGGTGDGSAGDGSGGTGGTPSAGGPMSTAPPMPGDVANKIIITLAVLIAAVVVVLVVYFAKRRRSA
jgi:hypothetical protein